MITLPDYIMEDIAEIQMFLRDAGLEDIRIEITASHLYAQNRSYIRAKGRYEGDPE